MENRTTHEEQNNSWRTEQLLDKYNKPFVVIGENDSDNKDKDSPEMHVLW